MRLAALVLVGACGGASGTASITTTTNAAISSTVTANLTEGDLGPSPDEVQDHLHQVAVYSADFDKLYVEVTSDGEHANVLRQSATTGLSAVPYVVSVDDGGELELHVEVAKLTPASDGTTCGIKIFVMRLPQHDLLAIADGSGRATGANAADTCLSATGTAVVRQKLPPFLQRQLDAK